MGKSEKKSARRKVPSKPSRTAADSASQGAASNSAPAEEQALRSAETVIVGVGASAGGIEACGQLLDNIPPDKGLSFVIVQHLDPDHESVLPEILARHSMFRV